MDDFCQTPQSNKYFQYDEILGKWITDEMAGFEFENIVGKLFYEKSIELIIFRSQLFDRSSSVILFKHEYSANTVGKPLSIHDSLILAKAIYQLDIPPARIDIGRLNYEWTLERQNFKDAKEFVAFKLKDIIGKHPAYSRPKDVVLFGFGRIGRLLAREIIIQGNGTQLRIRAIVTRSTKPEDISKRIALVRHDSIHGPFRGIAFENIDEQTIYLNGHIIKMLSSSSPEEIDYTAYGIHDALMIDNTGIYSDRDGLGRHLKAKGISNVLLTAPAKGDIPNIVYGVNHLNVDIDGEKIFSAASCTTNAVVPVLKVIEDKLGIVKGHIETVHSYTNDQNLLDNFHRKSRRGRSAPLNMVITSTGAASAAAKVIPSLKGKLTANAVRIPTPNVSLAILILDIINKTSLDEVNLIMKDAALHGELVEQIRYSSSTEVVSSDVIGDPVAGVYDSPSTKVSEDGHTIVLYIWYDNEFGYTCQVMRLAKYLAKVEGYKYY
ncbi:MAG: glyceraldehyde-3-phosphate dehydrogenase [Bacteroidetes bacterium]|nr:glyceraldehyde-3-phosphate dehydrogenase [Bacteroidota bacterium]